MKEQVYRISPDGKTVQTLAHNESPLGKSAKSVRMVRASHVRFDNTTQKWHVWIRFPHEGKITEVKQVQGYDTRTDALEAEAHWGNRMLSTVPQFVDLILSLHDDRDKMTGHEISG